MASLQLKPGYRYRTRSGHIFTATQQVEVAGWGTAVLGTVLTDQGQEPHYYALDGRYYKERETGWDIVAEIEQAPAEGALLAAPGARHLIDSESGQRVYPMVLTSAHMRYLLAGGGMPIIQFSYAPEAPDGYTPFLTLSQGEIAAARELSLQKER